MKARESLAVVLGNRRFLLAAVTSFVVLLALGVGPAAATAPVVTVEDASNVEYTTADVEGHVNPEGQGTSWRFQYATEADFSNSQDGPSGSTETSEAVSGQLTGLQPGTTYHLRLLAENGDGQSEAVAASTFETKPVTKPTPSKPQVSAVGGHAATFEATVDPNAPEDNSLLSPAAKAAYATHWWYTCQPGCGFSGPSQGDVEADDNPVALPVVEATKLWANQDYTVVLHASNAAGEETSQAQFTTPLLAPEVSSAGQLNALDPGDTFMTVAAEVNPNNSVTDCRVVYGIGSPSGNEVPCSPDELTGGLTVGISVKLSGLTPETDYRFKFIATSSAGTTEGTEGSFSTLSPLEAPSCSNQAIRIQQHAAGEECRAYEMVSPLDKNGADITGEGWNVAAARDGNAAVYQSLGAFAGTTGSGGVGYTQYLSRRTSSGWSTRGITPTPSPAYDSSVFGGGNFFQFSDDLRRGVLWAYDLPQKQDDLNNVRQLYRADTETGALDSLMPSAESGDPPPGISGGTTFHWGASSDLGMVSFETPIQLLPKAAKGVPNAYEWDHGTLRLAGVLPDATVPESGSQVPESREGVSSDGLRSVFYAASPSSASTGGPQQIYLRKNHTETAWVSESENHTTSIPDPQEVVLQWISPDAKRILFTSSSQLLAEDDNEGADLYLYTDGPNPAVEPNLELISHTGGLGSTDQSNGIPGNVVLGASDDAGRIYFTNRYSDSKVVMQLWDHGSVRDIGPGAFPRAPEEAVSQGATGGLSRVSPDGRFLVFYSPISDRKYEIYVYDAANNTLACASCPPEGVSQIGSPSFPKLDDDIRYLDIQGLRPRYLSADGRHVYFSAPEALVPADTNGVMDVYSYDTKTGHVSLVSSGKGEQASWFVNASASGDNVFFVTRASFVGADRDEYKDLYDARIDGGFPEPPPPAAPCSGDNCRNPLSNGFNGSSPATANFSGPANVHRKAHKHRRKHRHHRSKHRTERHHHHSGKGSGAGGAGR